MSIKDQRERRRSFRVTSRLLIAVAAQVWSSAAVRPAAAHIDLATGSILGLAAARSRSAPKFLTEDDVLNNLQRRQQGMRQREGVDVQRRMENQHRRVPGPDTLPFRPPLPRNPGVVLPQVEQP